jgi:hypothetical protein
MPEAGAKKPATMHPAEWAVKYGAFGGVCGLTIIYLAVDVRLNVHNGFLTWLGGFSGIAVGAGYGLLGWLATKYLNRRTGAVGDNQPRSATE